MIGSYTVKCLAFKTKIVLTLCSNGTEVVSKMAEKLKSTDSDTVMFRFNAAVGRL